MPTWTCACGSTFKQCESVGRTVMLRITDGMLGSVGAKGRNGRSRCARDLAETIARENDPQMLLFDQPPDD